MNVAALALRQSRAAVLLAAALVVGGLLAALSLPSSIYPPLEFPRIVIVAHSGTLPPESMSLIVTRSIEQVIMAVPGVRRVRSKSIRGGAEISAQFDPSTDMVTALQMVQNRVAEITGSLPAGTDLQIERMTPAIFPVFIMSLTGSLPTPDLYDYANFVVKPEIARVPGAGIIEVQASDTREIEVILDPARLAAAQLTVVDVSDALRHRTRFFPSGGSRNRVCSTWRSRPGSGRTPTRSPMRRSRSQTAPRYASRIWHRDARFARSYPPRHRQRARRGVDEHLSADRRQYS